MPTITIPNNWTPRPYQLDALAAFEAGKRRHILIWHRRAGKDSFSLNLAAIQAHREPGTYWHLFPLQNQARRSIWHGIGADGNKFLNQAFPQEVRAATRQQEMQIELKCGSIWQMAGSDQYDSLVGSNVRGVVFSEWALCDPAAWDYIRPIIRENGGFAVFITTFRGKNHAYQMYQKVKDNPNWYASNLDVTQTKRHDGSPVLTDADIDEERAEGMREEMIQQEYYNSPQAAFAGAFYATQMRQMRLDKRITAIPHEPTVPVWATFDLGMDDHTAIIYLQQIGGEIRLINSASYQGSGLPDIAKREKERLPFHVEHLYLPHDAKVRGLNTGKTRQQVLEALFNCKSTLVPSPAGAVMDGIEAVRNMLPNTWIDEGNNFHLIESLDGYRTEESTNPGVFRVTPLHSWETHLADALRIFAFGRKMRIGKRKKPDYSKHDRAVA